MNENTSEMENQENKSKSTVALEINEATTQCAEQSVKIAELLAWGAAKRVTTKNGDRMLRTAYPDKNFWAAWKGSTETLREAGIAVSKQRDTDSWEVCWWAPVPAEILISESKQLEASRATDVIMDLPCPPGLDYLPYQRAGIAFILNAFRDNKLGALICDEMGLGKTIQAIGTINAELTIKRVLVICPASLKINWHRELGKWQTRALSIGVADSKKMPATEIVIINYDLVKKHKESLMSIQWDLLIVDEAHSLKNPKALRTKLILGGKHENPIPAKKRLYITGTPICNRPKEIFGLISSLDPQSWSNFFAFAKRYCAAQQTRFGWDFDGASHLDELQHKLRSSIMIRRLKKDVLKELPAKRRQVIELPSTGKVAALVRSQLAIMDNWDDRLINMRVRVELAKVSDDPADYATAIMDLEDGTKASFAETAKLAHDVAMSKIPFVIDHVMEAIEEGKVILFAHHLDVIAELAKAFGDSAVVITGEVDCESRQKAVDRFQTDPQCKVFIGGLKAAGVGLTLTASSHVVFAELDWVPATMSQAEDRAHRIGQTDSVLSQLLVMEGSLDAHIAKRLVSKMKVIDSALDVNHGPRSVSELPIPPESVVISCIATEPVIYSRQSDDEVHADFDAKEVAAANLTSEQILAIHQGLKILAKLCDGASRKDGAGFNKFDSRLGHKLAGEKSLTPCQAQLGQKLTHKYRRQLGGDMAAACQAIEKPTDPESGLLTIS